MKLWKPFRLSKPGFTLYLPALALVTLAGLMTGCGSGSPMGGSTAPVGNTQVVVLLTSTANDQLVIFDASIASIALVDSAGTSTTVYTNPNTFNNVVEWMHLNGTSEPLPAVSIPQGTYTSATVMIAGCFFTNETFDGNTFNTATFDQGLCAEGTGVSTVNLPNPIKIAGSAMALSLNLQVSQSFTLAAAANPVTYTIDPVFTLNPVAIAAEPTDETNGKITGVNAQVVSVGTDGKTLTAQTTAGIPLNLSSNTSTAYQGIAGFSGLGPNLLVNFDATIQPDGSLLATRIEVDDPIGPTEIVGPFSVPGSVTGQFLTLNLQQEGCTFTGVPFCGNIFQSTGNTIFGTSGQFTNLAALPFPATFSGSNLLQGQNLSVSTPGTPNAQSILEASTVTLVPQTLNGTVTAVTNDGGFAVYTVTLAPYDLIPILQNFTSSAPPPHITSPTIITVYADTNALFLNSGTIAAGSQIRFRGLIFDDNGTLRMDANTFYDGVTE
jgi:hypothetical protein